LGAEEMRDKMIRWWTRRGKYMRKGPMRKEYKKIKE